MATTPNQKPVPSEDYANMRFNAGKLDEFVTSTESTYTDRLGQEHMTAEGIAATAGSAATAAVQGIYDNFASSEHGKGGSLVTLENKKTLQSLSENIQARGVASNPTVGAWDSNSSLMYYWLLTSSWVAGQDSNGVQTIAFDEKNRFIYAMYESTIYNTCSVLYRMPMDVGQVMDTPAWAADGDSRLGHQGFGIENRKDGSAYIWATKRGNSSTAPDPQSGCKIISFRVDNVPIYSTSSGATNEWSGRGGLYFEGVNEYQLWPLQNTTQNAQATISHDQKYLISKMNVGDNYISIRVFELSLLSEGGSGDYSDEYLYEFTLPRATFDADKGIELQGMASDGKHIYFYGGRGDLSPTAKINLQVYTIDGSYVTGNTVSNIGYVDQVAKDPAATIFEDESISFLTVNGQPQLIVQISGGVSGVRSQWLYSLGFKNGVFRGSQNKPAIQTSSPSNSLDLAAQREGQLSIGSLSTSGTMVQNFVVNGSKVILGNGEEYTNGLLISESVSAGGNHSVSLHGNTSFIRRAASTAPGRITFMRSRGVSAKESVALQVNDYVTEFSFVGDDGFSNWSSSGGVIGGTMTWRAVGAISAGIVPMQLTLQTMNLSGVLAARWILQNSGDLVAGADNSYSIGASNARAKSVYAAAHMFTATVGDFYGAGSPEGVLTAGVGSRYSRTDGSAGTCLYVKESGTGNTGWVAK